MLNSDVIKLVKKVKALEFVVIEEEIHIKSDNSNLIIPDTNNLKEGSYSVTDIINKSRFNDLDESSSFKVVRNESKNRITVKSEVLKIANKFVGKDYLRVQTTGIRLDINGNVVSTDSRTLYSSTKLSEYVNENNVIINSNFVDILLLNKKDEYTLLVNDRFVEIEIDEVYYQSQLVNGKYPSIESIILKNIDKTTKIDEMSNIIKTLKEYKVQYLQLGDDGIFGYNLDGEDLVKINYDLPYKIDNKKFQLSDLEKIMKVNNEFILSQGESTVANHINDNYLLVSLPISELTNESLIVEMKVAKKKVKKASETTLLKKRIKELEAEVKKLKKNRIF